MLIGLTGKAGAGKDSVADILCRNHGFERYAMAKPLKTMLASVGLSEPPRELKESPIPGFNFSWRTAAQRLGTEWGRGLDPDIWLKFAEIFLISKLSYQANTHIVITDIRFPNEHALVRKYMGRMIGVVGRESKLDTANATHASETSDIGMLGLQYINNAGTLEDLEHEVRTALMLALASY